MGNLMEPTEWGWRLENNNLTPIETDRPIAPDTLLNMVSCCCKADGCGVSCGCKRHGVYCSNLCSKCNGQTCKNVAPASFLLDMDEGEIEEGLPESLSNDDEGDNHV